MDSQRGQEGKRILFDEFHARWNPSTQLNQIIFELEGRGYIIGYSGERIDSSVLSGYDALVLSYPSRGFEDYEKEAIRSFVESGGGLIIFGEDGELMGAEGIIGPINDISGMFGIQFNSDVVVDKENVVPTPVELGHEIVISTFGRHSVTKNVRAIGYIKGCSLDLQSPAVGLAFGNEETTTAGEKTGKNVVILAATEEGAGRVLAIGDTDFIIGGTNRYRGLDGFLPFMDNEKLGLNMFEWASTKTTDGDRDGDGVSNSSDQCYNPGCTLVDSQGCPKDSDGDGVRDCDDDCPSEYGTTDNGCPSGEEDSDGDGVPDSQDGCYNPGCTLVDSQGCPKDSDGDGVRDCDDDCPSEYGTTDNGCPSGEEDSDGDGVPDSQDGCYNPGCTLVDSQGCPKDSDGDGVVDCDDDCPSEYSTTSDGCPSSPVSFSNTYMIAILGAVIIIVVVIIVIFVVMQKKGKKTEVKREVGKKEEITEETKVRKIICPFCKNEIEEDWVSCPHCGTKLKGDTRIY